MGRPPTPAIDRFNAKWVTDPNGCHVWTGKLKDGYGIFWLSDERPDVRAHVFSYGPVPLGYELHHRCENRACVNPAHMEPLTRAEHKRRHAGTKTHCPHGHPYSQENTYRHGGHRYCRTCNRDKERRRRGERSAERRLRSAA